MPATLRAKGLRVHATNAQDGSTFERTFDDFPVRIGRDPLNELALDYPFVSKFHAVVDLRGDTLVLRDLGSRNGTTLEKPTDRIASNHAVDLAASNFTFGIASLTFVVAIADVERGETSRKRGGAILSHVPSESGATFADDEPHVETNSGLGGDEVQRAADAIAKDADAWRAAWGRLYARVSSSLSALSPADRDRLARLVTQTNPAITAEPDFQRLASHLGVRIEGAPAASGSREESIALLVLRDLASWYVDAERPLQTPAQIVAFGRKIQDVLDALFTSFIPLRDGLRKFEADFEVKVGAQTEGARATATAAKSPADLATRLLDWNDVATDSSRTLKRFFADLMVHNVGLVNGVMRGAGKLLEQLAPEALEAEHESERARGVAPIAVGPLKYRALWDVLKRRHRELSSEERERMALVFGSEFANAYAALAADARASKTPEIARSSKSDRPIAKSNATTRTSVRPPPGPMGTEQLREDEVPAQPPPRAPR